MVDIWLPQKGVNIWLPQKGVNIWLPQKGVIGNINTQLNKAE
jgi:hypothetical protein